MKTLKTSVFALIGLFGIITIPLYSQDDNTCKVLKKELMGEYTGKCKKGLANGKGHAKGAEEYEGNFKNGYPHGFGVYHYADSSVYEGNFSEGLRDGSGVLTVKINGNDSITDAIWKDDAFVKLKPVRPYEIKTQRNISRYTIMKNSDSGEKVTISISRGGLLVNPPDVTLMGSSGNMINSGSYLGFDNPTFPFTCLIKYTMSNQMSNATYYVEFEFILKEPGTWDVKLSH